MSTVQIYDNLITNPRAVDTTGTDVTDWGNGMLFGSGPMPTSDRSLTGGPTFAPSYGKATFNSTKLDISVTSAVVPGQTYTVRSYANVSATMDVSISIRWQRRYLADPGSVISLDTSAVQSVTTGGWNPVELTSMAPVDAMFAFIMVTADNSTGVTQTLKATAFSAFVNTTGQAQYSGAYFDGSTTSTPPNIVYDWYGVAHQSASYFRFITPDPVLTTVSALAIPVPVTPTPFKKLQLTDFSVTEDSTPVDPGDSTGGTGQFTLEVDENDQSVYLLDVPIDLIDPAQGTTRGVMRGLNATDGKLSITADSRLTQLSVTRQAAPYNGTLSGAFTYYLGLCGITSGLVVDASIASRAVSYLGWDGNVWDHMKQMASAEQVELSLVSNNVVLRVLRGRVAENYRDSSRGWQLNTTQLSQSVEINYYNNQYKVGALAYPAGGWTEDTPVFSVDAGETRVETINLGASLLTVQQPTCQLFVAKDYIATSVYTVAGNDGLPIPPAQWTAQGGSVTVAISEDTRSLEVTIVGASESQYAPYRIGLASSTSDFYSTLRLVGTGVFFEKKTLTLYSSVDPTRISQVVGTTVDNEFISTRAQAYELGMWTLKRWGSAQNTLNVQTTGINRKGDTGSYAYPTFDQFNAAYAGKLFSDFNTDYAGKTFDDFNTYWTNSVRSDFANQAFGNVAGARVRDGDAWYRIRSATTSPYGVNYSAEEDTVFDDFNTIWAGKTFNDFNAEWAGGTFADFAVAPLRKR